MTDELDQAAIGEPEPGQTVGDMPDEAVSADASLAASLPSVNDINLENAEKAAKWGWKKLFGHEDRVVPTEPPVIDIPSEEETTMHSTWVEHEDPPPPPPAEPQHEAEHAADPGEGDPGS
jgi:hypothetical protein